MSTIELRTVALRGGRLALGVAWVLVTCSLSAAKVQVGVEDWGLGGAVKGGMWVPLYVEMTSADEDFQGTLVVTADAGQRVLPLFVKRIDLVRNTPARHWMYFRSPPTLYGRGRPRFTWRVVNAKGRDVFRSRWQRPVVLPGQDLVVAVLRTPNIWRAGLGALTDTESQVKVHVVFLSPQTAPDRAVGYESADTLVWLNPDPSKFTSVAQREALVDYVRCGGHLVLAAGTGWQALTKSFLADLLPARPTGSAVEADLPALAQFGRPEGGGTKIVVAHLGDVRGEALMTGRRSPVVVRGPVGLGQVTLIAFDPTASPFADLKDRVRFWEMVLDIDASRRNLEDVGTFRNASAPLIRTLNDFPGFKPINFALVAFFLVAYVVLIGPVDYFVLKRMGKLHWTWVTFPSIAILSSVLAFYALSSGRVVGLWTNSVSLVDASVDGSEMSGTTYMTMLSPRQTRYTVSLEGITGCAVVPREFEGLERTGGLGMGQTECHVVGAGERIDGLLVRIWDAQTMEACWRAEPRDLPEVKLVRFGSRVRGTITNTTSEPLRDAAVLFAGQVVRVGTIRRGKTVEVGGRRWRSLSEYSKGLLPADLRPHDYGGWRGGYQGQRTPDIEQAEPTARWISLLGCAAARDGGAGQRGFRRAMPRDSGYTSTVFDLPGRLRLTGLTGTQQAIVMYGVKKSLVEIRLKGKTPRSTDYTVVRLRVPLAPAGGGEGGPS